MQDYHAFGAAVPIVALAVDVVIQQVVFRAGGRRDVWGSIVAGCVAGIVPTAGLSAVLFQWLDRADAVAVLAMNLASFVALAYGYFTFVNLNFTSIRVRILRELSAHHGSMTLRQLLAAYDADVALTMRLKRLTDKGQITQRNDRYYLERPGAVLILAYVLDGLKLVILGRHRRVRPAASRPPSHRGATPT